MDKDKFLSSGMLEQYALGLTSQEESEEVERYLRTFPELRDELAAMKRAIENYAREQSIPPPPRLREARAASQNDGAPEKTAAISAGNAARETKERVYLPQWGLPMLLICGMAITFLVAENGKLRKSHDHTTAEFAMFRELCDKEKKRFERQEKVLAIYEDPSSHHVVLVGTSLAPDAKLIVCWNAKLRKAVIQSVKLSAPKTGAQYQLWADVNGKMISVGLLDHHNMHREKEVLFVEGAESLNVTLEPAGGSDTPNVARLYAFGEIR
jgi:anti-sigma-K factor RskA